MSTNEKVAFIQSHKPRLQAGKYTIKAEQKVNVGGLATTVLTGSQSKTVYVAAERYKINKTDIVQVFPPHGNRGNYHNVLPHISLKGSTFPWERHSGQTGLPWLWLFIYDDEDVENGNVEPPTAMALNSVFKAVPEANGLPDTTGLTTPLTKIPMISEPGETESGALKDTPVNVIQIKTSWLEDTTGNKMMPSVSDLQLMTTVRKNSDLSTTDPNAFVEHAICMANRMPKAGVKSYACLLSLEDRLTLEGETPAYQQYGVEDGMSKFACLYQWSFQCLGDQSYETTSKGFKNLQKQKNSQPDIVSQVSQLSSGALYTDQSAFQTALETASSAFKAATTAVQTEIMNCFKVPDETFEGFMTHLSVDAFGFDELDPTTPGTHNAAINQYLQRGASAFTHRLNNGKKAVSWYHGPFRPDNTAASITIPQGLQSSDQLLRFDTGLNMLDVSYAAAWELGRMLTLRNKTVAMDLFAWRKQQAWKTNRANSTYAGAIQPKVTEGIITKEEEAIQAWVNDLTALSNVPFNYLVPDERLLPEESIRFFNMDMNWMNCLLDGALSIGRTSTTQQTVEESLMTQLQLPLKNAYSGFILRSEAVSGWPHLLAEPTMATGTGSGTKVAEIKLGTDALLFLFEGEIQSVDIHLKPEGLHFGLNIPEAGDASDYTKTVRFQFSQDAANALELDATLIPQASQPVINTIPYNNATNKVIHVSSLSTSLKTNSEEAKTGANPTGTNVTAPFTSAEFAMEMVLPQAHINFAVGTPAVTAQYLEDDSKFAGTFVTGSGLFSSGALQSVNPNYSNQPGVDNPWKYLINVLGLGSAGMGLTADGISGEAQDKIIEAAIDKIIAGGAAIVEKLIAAAGENGITTQTDADPANRSEQINLVGEILGQVLQKGGGTLLASLLEDVFEKGDTSEQVPAPNALPTQQQSGDHEEPKPELKQHQTPQPSSESPRVPELPQTPAPPAPPFEPVVEEKPVAKDKPVDQLLEGILAKLKAAKTSLSHDEDTLKADAEKVVDKVKGEVTNVEDEVKDKVHDAVSDIESVPQKVKAYLEKAKLDVALTEAGLKITVALIVDRIKADVHNDVDKVKDKASELAQGILGHIHQAESDLADKAKGVVSNVKADIHKGVEKVVEDVHLEEAKAEDLKSEVADHIKDLETHVVSAAKSALTKVKGKVRSKVAELKAEEHLARQKEAQLLDEITDKIHEVKHGIIQKISKIKGDIEQDKADVLHDAHALILNVETRIKDLKTNLKYEVVGKFKDLEKEAIGFFKSPFDKAKQDVEEVKSEIHDDVSNVKAGIEKDIQWLKARKTLVWIALGLLLISTGIWIYRTAFGGEEPTPLLSHFEGVKQMDEIEFVKQHYEESVPVTDKDGQLEFLLSVPATVSGKMDMTQLKYELGRDSLMKITLPPVILSDVNVDLQNVTTFDDRGKSMKLFLSGGGKAYGKAYESIIDAVEQVKKGVLSNAIKNDLMEETRQSARVYLLHMANAIGYRVEFIEARPSASFEQDIENRVGKKLWEQLKHKVQAIDPVSKPAGQSTGTDDKREERRETREDKRENK